LIILESTATKELSPTSPTIANNNSHFTSFGANRIGFFHRKICYEFLSTYMRRKIQHHYTMTQNGMMTNNDDNNNGDPTPTSPPPPVRTTKRSVNDVLGKTSLPPTETQNKEANERGTTGSPANKKRTDQEATVTPTDDIVMTAEEKEDAVISEGNEEEEVPPKDSNKTPPSEKSVSFGMEETQEIINDEEDDDEDNEEQKKDGKEGPPSYLKAARKDLSLSFEVIPTPGQLIKRKNQIRATVRIKIPAVQKGPGTDKLKGNDPTSLLRKAIKDLLDMLKRNVDNSTVLFQWNTNGLEERDAVIKGSKLPDRITALKEYGGLPDAGWAMLT
jgi:hypothetical protein